MKQLLVAPGYGSLVAAETFVVQSSVVPGSVAPATVGVPPVTGWLVALVTCERGLLPVGWVPVCVTPVRPFDGRSPGSAQPAAAVAVAGWESEYGPPAAATSKVRHNMKVLYHVHVQHSEHTFKLFSHSKKV